LLPQPVRSFGEFAAQPTSAVGVLSITLCGDVEAVWLEADDVPALVGIRP